ncbi:MAG: YitT family protein [Eubacteriales bacterium]|nr:YitT family protein [Eubacteriales bacterium]
MHNIYRRKNISEIVVGTLLMAIAYRMIFDSVGMVTGGFSGIGIIAGRIFGVPLWLNNLVLNVPLFLAAWKLKGGRFIGKSVFGTLLLTVFLGILPAFPLNEADYLLAALFGGAVCGTGIGLVLRGGATTGGTDLLSTLIHLRVKHVSVAYIMQIIDGAVILLGVAVFGIHVSLYAVIAVYVTTLVSDSVMEGVKHARSVYIISEHYEELSSLIMKEVGRGVTYLYGEGVYSLRQRKILLCVVSKKQIPQIKEIVARQDASAFCFIGDVREVFGEGFVQKLQ